MPFVRFIITLIAGIIIEFYLNWSLRSLFTLVTISLFFLLSFLLFSFAKKYAWRWLQGIFLYAALVGIGGLAVYYRDIKNNKAWIGHLNSDSMAVLVTLQEPLVEKAKSYKAEATIESVNTQGSWKVAKGTVLLYFGKDSGMLPPLHYGSQVLFIKSLQEIKNSGNPGNFNYKQFNAFKDIYHQVFLKTGEYAIASTVHKNDFYQWLFNVRTNVINKLQQYIPGEKEAGVAEALLIGYRDDLDKDLVQAYSNTGVVHIIAISGLHLGMIYAVLVKFFNLFKRKKWTRFVKPLVILSVLWIFTLLAGAVPSIARSAVMFTFIIGAEILNKKGNVYNTLASSAFVMLCYNPYYLWDIGFQLSYIALISIVTFSKPIHNWIYIRNKSIDFFWELTAVTLAAQILTLPVILYSFHQFPNLFLLTNCLIVPLSTIILFAELVVLITAVIPVVAKVCGFVTYSLLMFMNWFIEKMSGLSFAVTDYIQNSFSQTILLYLVIISLAIWLLQKNKIGLFTGLATLLIFTASKTIELYETRQQQSMIVYNVPRQTAIDFFSGDDYAFVGDSVMTTEGYLKNFHLKPTRTLHHATHSAVLNDLLVSQPFMQFHDKRIVLLDKPYRFENEKKIVVDAIIISKNPKLNIAILSQSFECNQFVFDGSNSNYKINQWRKACDSLHLNYFITNDNGAFEMKL